MQNAYIRQILSFLFAGSMVLVLPFFAYADHTDAHTIEQLQQQVAQLLAQIVSLQAQLASGGVGQGGGGGGVPPIPPPRPACPVLTYNLGRGSRDASTEGQVSALQKFLVAQGLLAPDNITGYFGSLTERAVQQFQTNYGVVTLGQRGYAGYGKVGPLTRAKIQEVCGGVVPPIPQPGGSLTINPASLSLAVGESQQVRAYYEPPMPPCIDMCPGMPAMLQEVEANWSSSDTSIVDFNYAVYPCPPTLPDGSGAPPCNLTKAVLAVGKSAGMAIIKAVFTLPNGMVLAAKADVIVGGSGINLPPVISGVSGPTVLAINQQGTWTVTASDPENGPLSYRVYWGDEVGGVGSVPPGPPAVAPAQTTTFTHVYAKAATYTPIFYVTDNAGVVAQTSISVDVGGIPMPSVELKISPVQGLNKTFIAGTNDVELAQFTLDAANATEDIRIVQARLFADVIAGDIDNYQTLRLYDGNTQLNTGANVVNPASTPIGSDKELVFTIDQSFIVPKNSIKTLSLKGNITTGAQVGDAIKFDFSNSLSSGGAWIMAGAVSGKAVTWSFATVPGSTMTVATTGGWQVFVAPSQPTEKWVVGGSQGVVSNILRFTAINEDMSLTNLRLQLRQPARANDVTKIYLYDGNTLVTSRVPAFINGVEDFVFPTDGAGSFIIPKDSYKEMTVKVDLPAISSGQAGTAGKFVAVDFDGDGTALGKNTTIGRSSGNLIRSSTQTDMPSNGVRYFRSLPIIERLAIPVTTLYSGNNVLYKFKVTANPAYDVALRKVTFQTAITGSVSLSNITLWDTTENKRVNAAFSTAATNPLIIKIFADTTDYSNAWVAIPSGQTHIFELRADVVTLGGADSISTKLLGDTQYPALSTPMGTAAEVDGSSSSSIIWSDFSADAYTIHSLTTKDWTNGFKLPGMIPTGLDASTLSGGGCCQTPSITVLSPNGGETLQIGQTYQVKWSASPSIPNVTIALQKQDTGGGVPSAFFHIVNSVPNTGTYNWTINTYSDGKTPIASGSHKIRIAEVSGLNVAYDDSDAPFSITTAVDTVPPSIPMNLTATAVSSSQIDLVWTASVDNVGVTSYDIERCSGSLSCSAFAQIAAMGAGSSSRYSDNIGLAANTIYRYRVRAWDAAGNVSGYSNIAVTYTDSLPDLIIESITATPNPLTGNKSATINVKVKNIGTASASNIIIGTGQPVVVSFGSIACRTATLTPGGTCVDSFNFIAPSTGNSFVFNASADNGNTILESNENNNFLSRTFSINQPAQ